MGAGDTFAGAGAAFVAAGGAAEPESDTVAEWVRAPSAAATTRVRLPACAGRFASPAFTLSRHSYWSSVAWNERDLLVFECFSERISYIPWTGHNLL